MTPQRSTLLSLSLVSVLTATATAQHTATRPRTDADIETEVRSTLSHEEALQGKDSLITANVHAGIVTLSGHVPNRASKVLASTEIGQVRGVKSIMNDLDIIAAPTGAAPSAAPVASSASEADVYKPLDLPTPQALPVRTVQEINTKTVKAGDTFIGTVANTVYVPVRDNAASIPAIPQGSPVLIRVVEAKPAGRIVGYAELTLELSSIRLPAQPGKPAQDIPITTAQLSSKTNGRGTNTAEKAGGGAGVGAIIGAIAGGGKGAAIGAASGGALGVGANALMPGQQIDIKPETLLQFSITSPLQVTAHLHNGIPQEMPAANRVELAPRAGAATPKP